LLRIALVEPKASSAFNIYSLIRMPRLALPLLGTILSKAGYKVKVFCEDLMPFDWRELLQYDLVGISAITCTVNRAYQLMAFLERHRPNLPKIIGGPHVSELPEEALSFGADVVVRSEGEKKILPIVQAIAEGQELTGIPGISYLNNGQYVHADDAPNLTDADLDNNPFPHFSLIHGHERIHQTPIETSRGCPYRCKFCHVSRQFGPVLHLRSVESVLSEIEWQRPESVFFVADNFFANPDYGLKLLEGMIRRELRPLRGNQAQMRVGDAQEERVRMMKEAGFEWVFLGLESINPESLKELRKQQKIEEMIRGLGVFRKYEIKAHGMFMTGADSDHIKDIRAIPAFAAKYGITTLQMLILTPLPGTTLFEELDQNGRITSRNWALYTGHEAVFKPAQMSARRLRFETTLAMLRFYVGPPGLKLLRFGPGNYLTVASSFLAQEFKRRFNQPLKVSSPKTSRRVRL